MVHNRLCIEIMDPWGTRYLDLTLLIGWKISNFLLFVTHNFDFVWKQLLNLNKPNFMWIYIEINHHQYLKLTEKHRFNLLDYFKTQKTI